MENLFTLVTKSLKMYHIQKSTSKGLADAAKNGNLKDAQKILREADADVVNWKNKVHSYCVVKQTLHHEDLLQYW